MAVSLGRLKSEFQIDKLLFINLQVIDKTINIKMQIVAKDVLPRTEVEEFLFKKYKEIRGLKLIKDAVITAEQIENYPKHIKEIYQLINDL